MSSANASTSIIGRSYAQALFNTASRQGVVQSVVTEAGLLLEIAEKSPSLLVFLEGPNIPTENKREVLDKAFKGKINLLLMNLLYMLVDRERAELLVGVLESFLETAERADGICPARVASAREIGTEERLKLKDALEAFTGYKLKVKYEVQPALIGGVVFQFKDTLVDGSVRHELSEIRNRFLGPRRDAV